MSSGLPACPKGEASAAMLSFSRMHLGKDATFCLRFGLNLFIHSVSVS